MATNEFRQIRLEAGDVERSDRWYINAVRQFADGVNSPQSVFSSDLGSFETSIDSGNMMMFTYDAKHAETLPYYDKFPLSIIIEPLPNIGGFSGINLHYLPPLFRAEVLGALRETTEKLTDEKAQLNASWQIVKRYSQFPQIKNAVKKYIFGQVTSRFYKVNPIHWRSAVFLPTQQFTGATDRTVYRKTMLEEQRKKKPSVGMGSL